MRYRIFKNENKKLPYGTALAVVAAYSKEQAHCLILMSDEYNDEYCNLSDWEDTGLTTECKEPCIIAETRYQE